MKLFFKGLFITLVVFFAINSVYAGNYPYVCNNQECTSTSSKNVTNSQEVILLVDEEIENIKFGNILDSKFDDYEKLFGKAQITIKGYFDGKNVVNKKFGFNALINTGKIEIANDKKQVTETYASGIDYLLSNFTSVIDSFYVAANITIGAKQDQYIDLHESIVGYKSGEFQVKRICFDDKCTGKSDLSDIPFDSEDEYKFLKGNIINSKGLPSLSIVSDSVKINKSNVKAGESLEFNFTFEDYIDTDESLLNYKYEIFYELGGMEKKSFLSEEFSLKKNGSSYILEGNDGVLKLNSIISGPAPKFRITVTESMAPSKIGNLKFYFSVWNLTGISKGQEDKAKRVENLIISELPIEVIPNDEIGNGTASIMTRDFKDKNVEGFLVDETISIKITLQDEYKNKLDSSNNPNGKYDISLIDGSSEDINLQLSGSGEKSAELKGVKFGKLSNSINILLTFSKSGFHKLNGFEIKRSGGVSDKIVKLIPKQLYVDNYDAEGNKIGTQLDAIYVNSLDKVSEGMEIQCTNSGVTVVSECYSDNFSGCNNRVSQSIAYETERDNSIEGRRVIIRDYAYNTQPYQYVMNHIDKTAPVLTFKKGDKTLTGDRYNYKAAEDFYFEVLEKTTTSCINDVEINYSIKINDEVVETGVFNKTNMTFSGKTFKSGSGEYINFTSKVDLTKYLTKSGTHNFEINISDKYGNSKDEKITFIIFPTDEGLFDEQHYTLKVSSNGDKYANMVDNYKYTIENLTDKYGNPINNKKLISVTHSIDYLTGIKTIYFNEVDKKGESALDIYNINNNSNANGDFYFNLRSYAPGEYTQYFKAEMYGWDDNFNTDTSKRITFYPSITSNNKFKKPVSIEDIVVSTIETGSGAICSSNTVRQDNALNSQKAYLKYKLNLNNDGGLSNISSGVIDLNVNSIKDTVEGHKWLNNKLENVSNALSSNVKNSCIGFRGMITAEKNILAGSIIKNNNLKISYTLGGKDVSYILDEVKKSIEGCNIPTLGIKVEGILQSDGKASETGQEENFSDLSTAEMREIIRKNAHQLVIGMTNKQVLNGIKYIEGEDVTIGGNITDYETLIVKDGNVYINNNLNTNNKVFGIIVLKDNYNVNSDYKTNGNKKSAGNVYVSNDVEKINAFVYADGAFISAKDLNGTKYDDSELNKKLVLNGTLFTRNTIGGATELIMGKHGGGFLLPGGRKVTDYTIASYYDLNFIRRTNFCEGDPQPYSFLIRYDSKIQTSPPKGFSN